MENKTSAGLSSWKIKDDEWRSLNRFTAARIGLGRTGVSTPTVHSLAFQLAHAQAIDAVHSSFSAPAMAEKLERENITPYPPFLLQSKAPNRTTYLQQPDLGRKLSEESEKTLSNYRHKSPGVFDLAIVVADGLSAFAIEKNALPFLSAFNERLALITNDAPWSIAPLSIVSQGRVAVGDDICEMLKAKCVLLLIGERPGLSSPDSLGLYITWNAKRGTTDNHRNCISNIREEGMHYQDAADKAVYLLTEARKRKLTGVSLKDRTDTAGQLEQTNTDKPFLIET